MGSLTRYLPGSVETEIAGSGFKAPQLDPVSFPGAGGMQMPQIPGMPDISGALNAKLEIEAAREKRAAEMQRLQLMAMRDTLGRDRNAFANRGNVGHQGNSPGEEMQRLQLSAMQADERTMNSGAPLRMVGGAGITPGYMPDTNAMTGRQRKAFLPNSSDLTAVGAVDDNERQKRNSLGFGRFAQESAARGNY